MSLRSQLRTVFAFVAVIVSFTANAQEEVELLQPLDSGQPTVQIEEGAQTFINYFNQSADFLLDIAIGATLVWMVVSGIRIMVSGGDSSARSDAISKMTWAVIGLIILLFAGLILRTINEAFFI